MSEPTPEERLVQLDAKFGPGLGAGKERAKLQAVIDARPKPERTDVSLSQRVISPVRLEEGQPCIRITGPQAVLVCNGRLIPLQSLSQLKRLAAQNEFEAGPLVKQLRAHIIRTQEKP